MNVYGGLHTDGASARPEMAAKADATKPRLHFFIILNMAELRKFLKVRKGPLRSDTGSRRRAQSVTPSLYSLVSPSGSLATFFTLFGGSFLNLILANIGRRNAWFLFVLYTVYKMGYCRFKRS